MVTTPATWNPTAVAQYISQSAIARGIDPATAVAVAKSEGLNIPVGDAGASFGPFQLYTGGGLGNTFQQQTGLNPADYLSNWQEQVDFFLNWAAKNGWNPGGVGLGSGYVPGTGGGSHGASAAGISNWQGLANAVVVPIGSAITGITGGITGTPPSSIPTDTGGGTTDIPANPTVGIQGQTGTNATTGVQGQTGAQTTATTAGSGPPLNLNFAGSLQHIGFQFLLVLIAIAILLGGIYLLGSGHK